ncbi:MAG: FtsX-like permease family protein [Planctomycetaceae bacterium]
MSVWKLILKEISHRKLNFILSMLAVIVAVAFLTGATSLLKVESTLTHWLHDQHEAEFKEKIKTKEEAVKQAGAELQDEVRKIALGLGFNILILPENQDLNELHVSGKISQTFPEEYVHRIAEAKIVTINHLLPMVTEKMNWEEQGMEIILTGTQGEVPFTHRNNKKPLQDQVPAGSMVLGHEVHQQLKLKQGDKVTLKGKEFEVTELYDQRGTADDSTVWINLKEAQELLNRENLLNAILALECNCASVDRIGEIREELSGLLPGTKFIERGPPALARAEARNKAKQSAEEALALEQESGLALLEDQQASRDQLEQQLAFFTKVLVILIVFCATIWLGLLTYNNVRQRRSEIAILRTFGVRSYQILMAIIGRNFLISLAGAALGITAGLCFGSVSASRSAAVLSAPFETPFMVSSSDVFDLTTLCWIFLLAPVLAFLSGWLPAVIASTTDPASILQQES